MMRSSTFLTGTMLLALACLAPHHVLAFSGGPPDARTGAPGETTCTQCHTTFPLNSGTGALTLLGAPDTYTPGNTYRLIVRLEDPSASRWGFELTALDASNSAAGDLANAGTSTQTSTAPNGREYAKHTSSGTAFGTTGAHQWEFDWTAPVEDTGAVTFWFAGNAANGNSASSGDRIYNSNFTLDEETVTSVPVAIGPIRLLPNAPNPFNPRTELRFELDRASDVEIAIFDVRGRQVRRFASTARETGVHAVVWNGRDDVGRELSSGAYFVRLVADGQVVGREVTLLR